MKTNSQQSKLILTFYGITASGSALSAVASFLSIESYFKTLLLLGIALGARTLACSGFSYFTTNIINKIGIRNAFALSQVIGVLSLIILALGFHYRDYSGMLLGIMLTGIPGVFVSILLTIYIKVASDQEASFRQFSGRRELVGNCAVLTGAFLAPLLLLKLPLHFIFLLDGITYCVGFALLYRVPFSKDQPHNNEQANEQSASAPQRLLSSKSIKIYILQTSAALFLAGLMPLLAGSKNLQLSMFIPDLIRQWLWVVEDVMMIIASIIYLKHMSKVSNKFITFLLMSNSLWLLVALAGNHNGLQYLILPIMAIISLTIGLATQKFRDDLVLAAGDNQTLIKKYAAFAQLQRNFVMFLSPILLALLLAYTNTIVFISISICLQLLFFIGCTYYTSKRSASAAS